VLQVNNIRSGTRRPSSYLRVFQCLTLLGVLAPPIYVACIDQLPVAIELFLLVLVVLGFIGAVLWMCWLKTWHVVFPMLLGFALFPFALISYAGIMSKFNLDAVRDKVLAQLGSDSNFIVRRADYEVIGFDRSASWEIELLQPLPAPVLGREPGLIEADIDFFLRNSDEDYSSPAAIAKRLARVADITDTSGFRIYGADTHSTFLCNAPGHCAVELIFSPDSKVLLLSVDNF